MKKIVRNAIQNGTDVNEEFRQSKLDQIKSAENAYQAVQDQLQSGAITALGDNRYRVNTGWDRGEVIMIDVAALQDNALTAEEAIKGAHGLDLKADGSVALYHRTPAWWGNGTMIPAGLTDVDAVLKAAGLDFTISKRATPFLTPDGDWVQVPDSFTTVRTDADGTETPFATVGKIYQTVQNREAFAFLEKLFGDHEFIPETAAPLRGGRKVFISARMPEDMIVDPGGIADHIRLYLIVANSHDGTTPIRAYATPWRPECENTERFGLRDAAYSWTVRHTRNWADKYAQAAETLRLSTKFAENWISEETELVQASFTMDELDALITDVWGEIDGDASKRAVTMDAARRNDIAERWEIESNKVGATAYAAERAITGSVDHFTTLKPRDPVLQGSGNRLAALGAAILEDSLAENKNKAHVRLLELVRR